MVGAVTGVAGVLTAGGVATDDTKALFALLEGVGEATGGLLTTVGLVAGVDEGVEA